MMSLNTEIVRQFVRLARERGSIPIVVYFPSYAWQSTSSSPARAALDAHHIRYLDMTRCVDTVSSAERFVALLRETPEDWLTRRVDMIDTPGATLSGWRLLMMMIEHEVHHRSQIDSYAGLQGWPVPDIFNRSAESIDLLQSAQRARHGR